MTTLTASAVTDLISRALFTQGEIPGGKAPSDAVMVQGLVSTFGFHPGRIAEMKPQVAALLAELPDQFQKTGGGGWSFLKGCIDRADHQWGEQRDVEALVCLGIATGQAEWVMREMASVLPGGVPYFVVFPTAIAQAAA